MKKKKKGTTDEQAEMFAGTPTAAASMLAPLDIQNKEFRVSRMSGYRMRDVDEFLDQITDAMGALIAENERLRAAVDGGADREAGKTNTASPVQAASPDDAAAVKAFLRSERDFLRSLGSLVQGHAEQMKGMARSARPPATALAAPIVDDRPESAATAEPDPEPTAAMSDDEPEAGAEPVRVEEPQPAATGGAGEVRPERSLRELFWGEEG